MLGVARDPSRSVRLDKFRHEARMEVVAGCPCCGNLLALHPSAAEEVLQLNSEVPVAEQQVAG